MKTKTYKSSDVRTFEEIETFYKYSNEMGLVFDIGQITKNDLKILNKLVKKGLLLKRKARWPYVETGTCEKTMYYLPERFKKN